MPPFQKCELVDVWSAEANIGAAVRPFPRWMRCVKSGLLSPFDAGLFEIKKNRFRPERTRFVHKSCRGSKGRPTRQGCRCRIRRTDANKAAAAALSGVTGTPAAAGVVDQFIYAWGATTRQRR